MTLFENETVAAVIAVMAGLVAYWIRQNLQHRRDVAQARQMVLRLLEAHSDAENVLGHLDRLCDAVSQRGRLVLATIVVERTVVDACSRLAGIDSKCAFNASEFLASLEVFDRGVGRLVNMINMFIEAYPTDGKSNEKYEYLRRLICGQSSVVRKDRLTAMEAEVALLRNIPGCTASELMNIARKGELLRQLQAQPSPKVTASP